MKHFLHIVGARPNFMKIAPVMENLRSYEVRQTLIHTGQHYDARMSDVFFRELGLPVPDIYLDVRGGTHAEQTGRIMVALEKHFLTINPDWVIVAGDVNSTLAAALAAAKLTIPVAHIEAGLRSFDFSMPEEINRVATDRISTALFTHSEEADDNLIREGANPRCVFQVGNTMIDTLSKFQAEAASAFAKSNPYCDDTFYLVTVHRPSNVDRRESFLRLVDILNDVAEIHPVLFPVHPRTSSCMQSAKVPLSPKVRLVEPMGYLEFTGAMQACAGVITDSGGIQEESSWLGIPCVTLRPNTERNVTVRLGTNTLVCPDHPDAVDKVIQALNERLSEVPRIPGWDGCASSRIAQIMIENDLSIGDAYLPL